MRAHYWRTRKGGQVYMLDPFPRIGLDQVVKRELMWELKVMFRHWFYSQAYLHAYQWHGVRLVCSISNLSWYTSHLHSRTNRLLFLLSHTLSPALSSEICPAFEEFWPAVSETFPQCLWGLRHFSSTASTETPSAHGKSHILPRGLMRTSSLEIFCQLREA